MVRGLKSVKCMELHSYFLYAGHRFFHACLTSFTTVLKCLNLFNEMTDIFLMICWTNHLDLLPSNQQLFQ